jgi:predicted transposase
MNMDRTIKLKLHTSQDNKIILKETMNLFNTVFNEVAVYGFEHKMFIELLRPKGRRF